MQNQIRGSKSRFEGIPNDGVMVKAEPLRPIDSVRNLDIRNGHEESLFNGYNMHALALVRTHIHLWFFHNLLAVLQSYTHRGALSLVFRPAGAQTTIGLRISRFRMNLREEGAH